ncbi:kinase-like protein [Penicillium odoratum]|uniref:kinase-like protein n=1 Tax=Penicillium odoratum TaxID=1167516 RepID=UPI0025494419|nr:kinase-like protein [Penicillium odoratum]KAJ5768902.1 kinase-like protein [Penicillium odoratum]
MDDDFFAGHFKLDVSLKENRSRQVSYTSDPRRGIRKKRTVTIWNKGKFLAHNVYLERTGPGDVRVVKQILREDTSLDRCLTELRAMGRLSKENTLFVQFIGWFESSSHFYFAMEYCPLGDVAHCFPNPLSEAATRAIGRQVIEGLSRLHEIKIIHRDIKPQNILVQQKDPIWVKIADFGISKRVLDGETDLRSRVGTEGYIAPEVFGIIEVDEESSRYTSAVDVWSLGCLLHYILTKEPPFPKLTTLQYYCCDEDSVFPEEKLFTQGVGISGRNFIKRLLGVDPGARPKVTSLDIMTQWKIAGAPQMLSSSKPGPSHIQNVLLECDQEPNQNDLSIQNDPSDQEEQMVKTISIILKL